MNLRSFVGPRTLLGLCLALAALGSWTVFEESRPYLGTSTDPISRLSRKINVSNAAGYSTFTQKLSLMDCSDVLSSMKSLVMQYQPAAVRESLPPHCADIASNVLVSAPTNSFAWYVKALAAAQEKDWGTFNDSLANSQSTGRTEQWIAERRINLAEDNIGNVGERALTGNDDDLHMLIGSVPGIHAIARRYLAEPDFRERITAIVETMPEQMQKRFVNVIKTEFPA